MAEPTTTAIGLGAKWGLTAVGSIVGSAVSLVVVPAKNHKDAAYRGAASVGITVCISPTTTRFAASYFEMTADSIPDLTLAVASMVGLASWSLIGSYVKVIARHSDAVAEDGLAGLFRKKRR